MDFNQYKKIQATRSTDPEVRKQFFDRAIARVQKLADYFMGKVADIGCGEGHSTLEIMKLGFDVVGLDLIEFRVKEARKKGLEIKLGIMSNLPFKDKEFDTGFYSHVLEHAYDFDKAVSEAKRVFRRLIIIVPIETKPSECHTSRIEDKKVILDSFPGKVLLDRMWTDWIPEFVYIVDL